MDKSANNTTGSTTVFVTSAYNDPEPITSLLRVAGLDKFKKFKLTDDPDTADVIFFVENSRYHSDSFFSKLKNHQLVKMYPHKVFMYNAHDKPWFILPGLYASMPKDIFDSRYMTATPYIETINPYIKYDSEVIPDLLFSFFGNPNSGPRRKILHLQHPRGAVKATGNMFDTGGQEEAKMQYAGKLIESKFILCPKGAGTSSFRIFETMQAGRVPVIVSDNWVRPPGPDWDKFALFIPEDQVEKIPQLLEVEEANWAEKSKLARETWENFFASDTIFNYLIENLLVLKNNTASIDSSIYVAHIVPFLKYCFRKLVIQRAKKMLGIIK